MGWNRTLLVMRNGTLIIVNKKSTIVVSNKFRGEEDPVGFSENWPAIGRDRSRSSFSSSTCRRAVQDETQPPQMIPLPR